MGRLQTDSWLELRSVRLAIVAGLIFSNPVKLFRAAFTRTFTYGALVSPDNALKLVRDALISILKPALRVVTPANPFKLVSIFMREMINEFPTEVMFDRGVKVVNNGLLSIASWSPTLVTACNPVRLVSCGREPINREPPTVVTPDNSIRLVRTGLKPMLKFSPSI